MKRVVYQLGGGGVLHTNELISQWCVEESGGCAFVLRHETVGGVFEHRFNMCGPQGVRAEFDTNIRSQFSGHEFIAVDCGLKEGVGGCMVGLSANRD